MKKCANHIIFTRDEDHRIEIFLIGLVPNEYFLIFLNRFIYFYSIFWSNTRSNIKQNRRHLIVRYKKTH